MIFRLERTNTKKVSGDNSRVLPTQIACLAERSLHSIAALLSTRGLEQNARLAQPGTVVGPTAGTSCIVEVV